MPRSRPKTLPPQPAASVLVSPSLGDIRIGISGWRYKGWRGIFYPPKLQQRRELEFASRLFNTIEINGTSTRSSSPPASTSGLARPPTTSSSPLRAPASSPT